MDSKGAVNTMNLLYLSVSFECIGISNDVKLTFFESLLIIQGNIIR